MPLIYAAGLRMGRGGFSVDSSVPMGQGRVAFRCGLPGEVAEIAGQGHVRWYSRTEQRVGVEVAYLEPECREWVVGEIGATRPVAFVPSA